MTSIDTPTSIRKAMLANGFEPLPNEDKHVYLKGWTTVVVTDEVIDRWSRNRGWMSTGSRLTYQSQLDVDIDHAFADQIIARWQAELPHLWAGPILERGTDASLKVSFFFRLDRGTPPILRSRGWRDPADPGKVHKVEVLSGPGRQAGVFGWHSKAKGSSYVWYGDDPTNTRLGELPVLTTADAARLLEIADEMMEAAGWEQVAKPFVETDGGDWIHDITADMVFECEDGVTRTLAQMMADVDADGLRCSASFFEGPTAIRTDRCIAHAFDQENGDVFFCVHDFDTGTHGLKQVEVADIGRLLADEPIMREWQENTPPPGRAARRGGAGRMGPGNPPTPRPVNTADTRADELLDEYVFWAAADKTVWSVSALSGRSFTSFQIEQRPFCATVPWLTPAGNPTTKNLNPADIWAGDDERITVEGVNYRVGMPTLYSEGGYRYLNEYRSVAHVATGGSSKTIWEFIEQLVPDPADRKYFIQHLAYKFRHPEVPGPGVVMVAQDEYGTGRGTFFFLLRALFGERNVGEVPYHMFSGRSYQSQYNGWLLKTVVFVNESEDTGEQSKTAARNNAWANLKQHIEPRLYERMIVRKGLPNIHAMVSATVYVAVNDLEELAIKEKDRRCFVIYNGFARDSAFWVRVNESIERAADVGAFAADLLQVDLAGYDPYAPPPVTEAKIDMTEAGKSDQDVGLDMVLGYLKKTGCAIFSMAHVINGMTALTATHGLSYFDGWERRIGKVVGKRCKRVGVRDGQNWTVKVNGKKWATYAWDKATAARFTKLNDLDIRRGLHVAGPLDGGFGAAMDALDALRDGDPQA